ncbi:MAG: peptidylprolyl isomerase [Methanobacteriota archaeon]
MKFLKIDYTAQVEDGVVFDTTDKKKAEEAGIFNEKRIYAPLPIVVGEGQVIAGLDEALEKLKVSDSKKVEIPPEKGYGLREPSLLRIVPLKVFKKEKINPVPGMPVELDGRPARIQTVAGGRVRVDFNHDLAGKTLTYDVKVVSEATTEKDKVLFLAEKNFDETEGFNVKVTGKKVEVTIPEKAAKDRAALVRKASLSAELFKFLNTSEVSYTEVWKNPSAKAEKT